VNQFPIVRYDEEQCDLCDDTRPIAVTLVAEENVGEFYAVSVCPTCLRGLADEAERVAEKDNA
jgi:hypothetical protein